MAVGVNRSTWPKGQKPPVQRPKGSKNKKTLLKEKLGLQNWEGFQQFCKTEGATKLTRELQKLKAKDYVTAMQALMEFVYPKMSRLEVKGDPDNPLSVKITLNLNPTDQK